MLINKTFTGKMNQDADPYRVPENDYIEAWNITRDAQGAGQDMVVSNIPGNRQISYTLPAGTNKVIGAKEDAVRNRIYYFVWNSNDNHSILYFDGNTETVDKLLISKTNSAGNDILNFDPSYRINHIDIIYREVEGDLLFWTDTLNKPMVINVQDAINDLYGNTWKKEYLTVARPMPLVPPTNVYADDANVSVNNLRKTLYQFRYRWVYRDGTKSTFSPWGKLLSPNDPDSVATQIDPEKNNRINVTVQTGDADCEKIEVVARQIAGAGFSDGFIVATLNKDDLSILDNTSYTYSFYNDGSYPFVTEEESNLLFDYVPKKANTQALPNGNVLCYCGITEGVTFTVNMDVTMTPSMIVPSVLGSLALTFNYVNALEFSFKITGTPGEGDSVVMDIYYEDGGNTFIWSIGYTVQLGDTLQDVIDAVIAAIDAVDAGTTFDASQVGDSIVVVFGSSLPMANFTNDTSGSIIPAPDTPSTDEVSNSIYKHNSRYRFGLVYFDEDGVTDGVKTSDNFLITTGELTTTGGTPSNIPTITAKIFHRPPANAYSFSWVRTLNLTVSKVTGMVTSSTKLDGTNFQYLDIGNLQANKSGYSAYEFVEGDRVRVIGEFSVGMAGTVAVLDFPIFDLVTAPPNITPDTGSVYLKIPYEASAALTANDKYFIEIYTPATNVDAGAQVYYEFGETYPILNPGTSQRVHAGSRQNQFGNTSSQIIQPSTAPTATVVAGSGLSIGGYQYKVAFVTSLGLVSEPSEPSTLVTTTGGNQQINLSAIPTGPAGTSSRILYRTKADGTSFFVLATINDNSTTTYNDTVADVSLISPISQPAVYNFTRGDFYYRSRIFPTVNDGTTQNTIHFTDQSVSDLYPSRIVGNGRPFIIDEFAGERYYPTLMRYSLSFQQDTNINETNRFYFENQDTYDRANGDVMKLHLEGRRLYVFHKFDIGVVPVFTQVVRDTTGNPLEANSDIVLNKIQYPYQGKWGIGEAVESFAYYRNKKYFVDPNKGVVCRLAENGVTPLSTVYGMNAFFTSRLPNFRKSLNTGIVPVGQVYTGDPVILGGFDYFTNKYVINLEQIIRYSDPNTVLFTQGTFTLIFLDTDSPMQGFETFATFYPESMVSLNNKFYTFSLGQIWAHDNTEDYANFYGVQADASIKAVFTTPALGKKTFLSMSQIATQPWGCTDVRTSTNQASAIPVTKFKQLEGMWHAPFFRARTVAKGIGAGDSLKGNYIIVKFEVDNEPSFAALQAVSVRYINSPLTAQ